MAAAILTDSGKIDDNDLELICSSEKLSVKITHPSKLYFWKGELSEEALKEKINIFRTIQEFYTSLLDVLHNNEGSGGKVVINYDKKSLQCSFQILRRTIDIDIHLALEDEERMRHRVWNKMISTVKECDSFKK